MISSINLIDGQNLHLGTTENNWKVDHKKFRVYLRENYHVDEAYYFLGFLSEEQQDLYGNLQKAGFIVSFKEHNKELVGKKKGNVDTDIVFEIMKKIVDGEDFQQVVLVSGDGDYKRLVDYLIKKNRFNKILFPNDKASTLYNKLGSEYFDYLKNIRSYIEYK